MKYIASLFIILTFAMIFGIAGTADYEAEVQQGELYCDMVREGHWPHYNKSINCDK